MHKINECRHVLLGFCSVTLQPGTPPFPLLKGHRTSLGGCTARCLESLGLRQTPHLPASVASPAACDSRANPAADWAAPPGAGITVGPALCHLPGTHFDRKVSFVHAPPRSRRPGSPGFLRSGPAGPHISFAPSTPGRQIHSAPGGSADPRPAGPRRAPAAPPVPRHRLQDAGAASRNKPSREDTRAPALGAEHEP